MTGSYTDDAVLSENLDQIFGDTDKRIPISEVRVVVDAVLETLQGDLTSSDVPLYLELESLANYIEQAKSDIASLRPDEVNEEFIPKATDELDAIVDATAVATNNIMDCAEIIEAEIPNMPAELGEVLTDATMKIFEACGFQDITGQRITKVIKTLSEIEDRVDKLVDAFGVEIAKLKKFDVPKPAEDGDDKEISDEDLLDGPQHKHEANSQAEIDALLASFD